RLACRGQQQTTVRRRHVTDRAIVLPRHRLPRLGIVRGRGQDGTDGIQEVPQGEATDLAALVGEAPTLLVQPGPPQDLHPTGTTLVGCRRGDDAPWVKILRL